MSSKMVNQEYHVCPECDKSFKHLIPHLKNKHAWQVEDIFNFNRKVYGSSEKETELHDVGNVEGAMDEDDDDHDDESQYAVRKVSEVELQELQVEANARRAVDKTVMMHGLGEINSAIRNMYENIEESMQKIVTEASKIYMRTGGDVIDGPRLDSSKRVRAILKPSSEHLCECVMHELCHISSQLKSNITSIL